MLAHFFVVARLKAELTVEELAEKSGIGIDDLVDFERRQLHKFETAIIAEKLMSILDVDEEIYRRALLDSGQK